MPHKALLPSPTRQLIVVFAKDFLNFKMLVSVHIPKTGGTSLLHILKRKFGKRLLLDYPDVEAPKRGKFRSFLRGSPLAVHGHIPASKYDGRRITFLRDPVERRISAYHYIYRAYGLGGKIVNADWELALSTDLNTYLETPSHEFQKYLDVPPEDFSFIGQMHQFDQDLELLCRHLELPLEPVTLNRSPVPIEIQPDQRKLFEKANQEEIELFRQFSMHAKEM